MTDATDNTRSTKHRTAQPRRINRDQAVSCRRCGDKVQWSSEPCYIDWDERMVPGSEVYCARCNWLLGYYWEGPRDGLWFERHEAPLTEDGEIIPEKTCAACSSVLGA